ncbi:unnamed protein product [Rhizoctonia solani]|uniref:DUF6533 domain-containing protein n=1 Tax=Rhizoctonia solani TaxID=456999 RepID=A0A8H2WSN4_9AGAM|nr:unnamed protein product [Rhizoctonia solani]
MSSPGFLSKVIVDIIENFHGQQQLAKHLAIVSFTLLVYDWVVNIDLEVEFIWGRSWSGRRIVYHVNRILPIALLGVSSTVILFVPSPGSSVSISSFHSIHRTKRLVVWILCGVLIAGVIANIVTANLLLARINYLDNPLPDIFTGCILTIPDYVWILYLVPMIYECALFILTTWRIYVLSRDYGRTRLIETLAHSGITYFAILVGLVMFSCIGGTVESIRIAAYGSGGLPAISSVVCSHMIFSLHQIAREDRDKGYPSSPARSNTGVKPQSAIPLQSVTSANTPYA